MRPRDVELRCAGCCAGKYQTLRKSEPKDNDTRTAARPAEMDVLGSSVLVLVLELEDLAFRLWFWQVEVVVNVMGRQAFLCTLVNGQWPAVNGQ